MLRTLLSWTADQPAEQNSFFGSSIPAMARLALHSDFNFTHEL